MSEAESRISPMPLTQSPTMNELLNDRSNPVLAIVAAIAVGVTAWLLPAYAPPFLQALPLVLLVWLYSVIGYAVAAFILVVTLVRLARDSRRKKV